MTGKIQIVVSKNCNTTFVLPENYEYFKEFYDMLKAKHAEQIILKSI